MDNGVHGQCWHCGGDTGRGGTVDGLAILPAGGKTVHNSQFTVHSLQFKSLAERAGSRRRFLFDEGRHRGHSYHHGVVAEETVGEQWQGGSYRRAVA